MIDKNDWYLEIPRIRTCAGKMIRSEKLDETKSAKNDDAKAEDISEDQ